MRAVLANRHTWISLGACGFFWIGALATRAEDALLLANCLVTVTAFAVAVTYAPWALRVLRGLCARDIENLVMGTLHTTTFAFLWGAWSFMLIASGWREEDVETDLSAFFRAGIAFGLLYLLSSPGTVPRGRFGRTLAILTVGCVALALAGVFALVKPDASALMAAIRPWLPR